MKEYNYSYNEDTRELTIYEDSRVLATISDVEEEQVNEMFKEVIFELREIKLWGVIWKNIKTAIINIISNMLYRV